MGLVGQYDPMTGDWWTPWGGSSAPIPGVDYGPYAPVVNLPADGLHTRVEVDHGSRPPAGGEGYRLPHGPTLSIPEDAYPWSKSRAGLPEWGLEPLKQIAPQLPGLMDSFQGALDRLGKLPGLVDQWVDAEGRAYISRLRPFREYVRKPLEGLASRGVLDSTMTRDAITNLGGLLADDFRRHQEGLAAKGLQVKASGLVDEARLRGMGAELAGELLNMGRTQESSSEDKLARYTGLLGLLLI